MKININQTLKDVDGVTSVKDQKTGKDLTLKDVCIGAVLMPVPRSYGQDGSIIDKGDSEKEKFEKWDIFKKLRDAVPNEQGEIWVELVSDTEVAIVKKWLAYFQPQLILGQAVDMIEGKV
ncbi:MAG: hypothetical protein WC554_07780 [Clostridia bacterium]